MLERDVLRRPAGPSWRRTAARCVPFWDGETWLCEHRGFETDVEAMNHAMTGTELMLDHLGVPD